MEIEQVVTIINFLLALFTLYPSLALLRYLIKTRSLNNGKQTNLSNKLLILFLAFTIGAILNSLLYLFTVFELNFYEGSRHDMARARSLIVNIFFAWTVWGIYLFNKKNN